MADVKITKGGEVERRIDVRFDRVVAVPVEINGRHGAIYLGVPAMMDEALRGGTVFRAATAEDLAELAGWLEGYFAAVRGSLAGAVVIEGDYSADDWYGQVRINGRPLDPAASLKVRRHSPDGFSWGYAGSGPAQLALGILLEVLGDREKAERLYQRFKFQHIAGLPNQAPFRLELDVVAWADGVLAEAEAAAIAEASARGEATASEPIVSSPVDPREQ